MEKLDIKMKVAAVTQNLNIGDMSLSLNLDEAGINRLFPEHHSGKVSIDE
jgi:hypothetical protein